MNINFVTEGSLNEYWEEGTIIPSDVLCFGFNGLDLVSYKKELDGETNNFEDVALLSKELANVVITGLETDTYGSRKKSVVIAEKGKILGVSDMTHIIDKGDISCGSGFRVYDTSIGKIGIIVDDDIYFPEVYRVLALCDSDVIFAIVRQITDTLPQVMIRANSFANGVSICLCSYGICQISDIKGQIILNSPSKCTNYDIKLDKDFHLIESRQRGFYKEFNSNY